MLFWLKKSISLSFFVYFHFKHYNASSISSITRCTYPLLSVINTILFHGDSFLSDFYSVTESLVSWLRAKVMSVFILLSFQAFRTRVDGHEKTTSHTAVWDGYFCTINAQHDRPNGKQPQTPIKTLSREQRERQIPIAINLFSLTKKKKKMLTSLNLYYLILVSSSSLIGR